MDKKGFTTDDLAGVVLGFLANVKNDPEKYPYITKEGFAFLGGYCKANNTISLIESEKYDKLLKDFEDLIEKYAHQKIALQVAEDKHYNLVKNLKQKKRWFEW